MKSIRNKKVLISTVVLTLLFTVVAYAYSEGSGGSIMSDGDDVVFNASVYTSLNASELNEISLYHEATYLGQILFRGTQIDRNQYYNEFSDPQTEENASPGIYESVVIGRIDYVHPNYTDYSSIDESEHFHNSTYKNNLTYKYYKDLGNYLLNKTNAEVANSFGLDLSLYTKISRDDPKFKEDKLFVLCPQAEAERGDSIPTIYLDKTNNSGIVLKQDKNGLNYKYSFVRDDINYWIIVDKETTY